MVGSIASSPAVDLSTLPPPTVVEQPDFETLLAQKVARFAAAFEAETGQAYDALLESDPAMKLLQASAYFQMVQAQAFNEVGLARLLAFAGDADLDQLGALVDCARHVVTPATGTGEAVMESDAAYKRRIQLAPHAFSVAGPEQAYVYHALATDGSLSDATAVSPRPDDIKALVQQVLADHEADAELTTAMATALDAANWPGDVIVTVLAANGDGTPTDEQVAAVDAVLQGPVRPLTDHVKVTGPELIDYEIDAKLYVLAGPDETLILETAQASLDAYLASVRKLGRDRSRTAHIAALHVGNVVRVDLVSPAADIVCDDGQLGNATAINITIAGTEL
ncbi:MAG: baseplate assembly protein [Novosphingobium sp.]|nr:baseplate assembly protein [Novosphingobium sp.]|tara:strand:- start:106 stop:1116 length:1011 start_codon:yes stop_codon:yes gene_type:complete